MAYGLKLQIWGDAALFSRPELRVERVSYDCITPSAARGILEAILWKPAIRYVVDRICVQNPILMTNVRRNEVSQKISARVVLAAMTGREHPLYLNTKEVVQQRASLILKNVCYVIEAHFELTDKAGPTDTAEKFYAMFCRRAKNGQCHHQPYLGCREFPARFRLYDEDQMPTAHIGEVRDMGLMLYAMDYEDPQSVKPVFFRAVLKDGVLDVQGCEIYR